MNAKKLKPIAESVFLNEIINNTPAAYLVINREMDVVFANDFVVKIAGISRDELLGKKCYEAKGKSSICDDCIVCKAIASGKKEYRLNQEVDRAGNTRFNDNYGIPLVNEDGSFDYIMEILTDRTEEIKYQKQLANDFYHMIDTFSQLIEAKDLYTADHSCSVRDISILIAKRMNLSEREMRDIYVAASLHDIGKIGIPDSIINKPGKLDEDEYNTIKKHPEIGMQILSKLSSFDYVKQIIQHHHERFDGKGYPTGLSGNDIPIGSRIICVADTYDAMTSDRSYRKGMSHSVAAKELQFCSGGQFDPSVVSAFFDICAVWKSSKSDEKSLHQFIFSEAENLIIFDEEQ